jgi:hypothetical protein
MILVFAALAVSPTSATPLTLDFDPLEPDLASAADEYRAIWREDGRRIVAALEKASGATLAEAAIDVIVFEGISRSGRGAEPMHLRASNPPDGKRAALTHELAHRYITALALAPGCRDDVHDLVAPVLIEVWSELWGEDFLVAQAGRESRYSERYRRAWADALESRRSGRALPAATTLASCARTSPERRRR